MDEITQDLKVAVGLLENGVCELCSKITISDPGIA
jgi:hypothetical protein